MAKPALSLAGKELPAPVARPCTPAGPSPLRRPGSVRRTTSIDARWPHGPDGLLHLSGHARDIWTPEDGGAPRILAEDRLYAQTRDRIVRSLEATPERVYADRLVGARAGGRLRAAIDLALPGERQAGTPLYLLLDDLAGVTLIADWGRFQWDPDSPEAAEIANASRESMEGVCIGFRPGSSALGVRDLYEPTRVPPLIHSADLAGWHPLPEPTGDSPNFRRARRMDIWRENGRIHIDATFQDSAVRVDGSRVAVHEYLVHATTDAAAGALLSVEADGRILPFPECPAATVNIGALVGTPMADLRERVLDLLHKTAGCTHLNDALRALAEVPVLAKHLPKIEGRS